MVRTALVGCGHIAGDHLRAVGRTPGVRVVALCDHDRAAVERLARLAPGASVHTDFAAMLAEARPHVVHVLTPPPSHRDLVLKAVSAGCHVLVEKPLAMTVGECDDVLAAAGEAGRTVCVAHNFLFEPGVRKALDLVAAGAVGRITAVEVYWRVLRGASPETTPPWLHALPGGVFHEVAPHPVYLVDGLLRGVRVVAAHARRTGSPGGPPDELRVLFDGESAVATLGVSVGSQPHLAALRIHGTRQTVLVDLTTNVVVRLRKRGTARVDRVLAALDWSAQYVLGTAGQVARILAGRYRTGRERLVQSFYASLSTGSPPPVSGAEGRRTVALLDDIWARVLAAGSGGSPVR